MQIIKQIKIKPTNLAYFHFNFLKESNMCKRLQIMSFERENITNEIHFRKNITHYI